MRKVLIATPCYDGKLSVWYTNALLVSMQLCSRHNIALYPVWMSYDALINRSRNDLATIFIENDFDDVVWIDSDIEWNPEWILKLLNSDKDVIGGTYRKKTDEIEEYVLKKVDKVDIVNGLLEVDGLGFGFIKLSRKAMQMLWDAAIEYHSGGKTARNIFECGLSEDRELIGEDIMVCKKIIASGLKIYLDVSMTCNHIGDKKFVGNFSNWINRMEVK